ncbi:D-alanyl-D-alanine carboxypeptidase/D-alanyl-D-alanine-endopeptidase [Qipengyuania sp. JC766]|uniref:D-alanyl-D-alanine carboxypeptidase/D-alanyl-D-alanine endopeptidase n=1 Tax=Qipengyuania sp. JC766 TaxID=3232139 RepID=UPI00345AECCC
MRTFTALAAACLIASPLAAQEGAPPAPSLPAQAEDQALLQQVVAILADAPPGTRYGIMVERADGSEVLSIAPDQRFIPASNTKIYTTLAAYADLPAIQAAAQGTGVRLEPAGDGTFDVVLEGRGEATLSSAPDCTVQCLSVLADAVAARTPRVRNVVGDARWYPDQRWSPGMSWNNMPFGYGTGISALSLDDNEFVMTVTPAGDDAAPVVTSGGYYRIDNRARSVAGTENEIDIWRMPGSDLIELSGTIGTEADPRTYTLGIDDPARYAAWRLARMLADRGVTVTGDLEVRQASPARASDIDESGTENMLAQLAPEDLAADVVTINKVSQNMHSELMLRRIGRVAGDGSIESGQAALARVTARAGLPEGSYLLADGSGMSSYNRLTPRGTTALLRWAAEQPWGATWRESLPVGGEDGTLGRRFRDTPLAGRIFAKTGSLNASRALSGYLVTTSGETLVFSAFANDIPPGEDGAATAAMDAALLAIAAGN